MGHQPKNRTGTPFRARRGRPAGRRGGFEEALQRILPGSLRPWARWIAAGLALALVVAAERVSQRVSMPGPGGGDVEGPARLVDGDSLFIGRAEIRLKGIDAPEGRQHCTRDSRSWPCGEESRKALSHLIAGRPVHCRAAESDQHGRLLAFCTAGGIELNREMVRSGFAVAYGQFEAEQREAKAARRGLWSGEFVEPREWRRSHGAGG